MPDQPHPFHAVAKTAAARGMDALKLKVERDGAYVRLYQDAPPVFFKHRNDPTDSFDRTYFEGSKRLMLSDEDCAKGPGATLDLIQSLLEKFADYKPQRP